MAPNDLYPGFIKLHYENALSEHIMTIPVKPFVAVSTQWFLEQKGNPTGELWTTALNAYVTVLKPIVSALTTFTYAELWTIATPGGDPIYRESVSLNIVGTNVGALIASAQYTMSYRTILGGNGKVVLLDVSIAPNAKAKPTYGTPHLALSSYLLSATSIVAGRDGSFPVNTPKVLTKTNDVLRRKYNLA